jgi:cytochrome bd-type quinol oxidase subunit 2
MYDYSVVAVFVVLILAALAITAVTLTIRQVVSLRRSDARPPWHLWAALVALLAGMYAASWLALGPVEARNVYCGSALSQWLVALPSVESKFDDLAMQDACSRMGMQQVLAAITVTALSVVIWFMSWRVGNHKNTTQRLSPS